MYLQARIYIKTALVYLALALSLGGGMLLERALSTGSRLALLSPVFYHLLTVGWLTQLIVGVALWMFPPVSRSQPRGDERVGWLAYAVLNAGLALRVVAEPLYTWTGAGGVWLAVSALLQVVAAWLLVAALWPRVKGKSVKVGKS